MIKIIERGYKLNGIDDANRLVGFDLEDDCCAHGGWFVSKRIENTEPKELDHRNDLPEYSFDEAFFQETKSNVNEYQAVVFKMVAKDKPDLYLHLFNVHNGYYSKGFRTSFGRKGSV